MKPVELYARVRHAGHVEKLSQREAARRFGIDPKTVAKMLRYSVPPGAVALQFSMRDPRITSTICGVSKPERVQQTLEWAGFPIPEALWEDLRSVPHATDDPEATRVYRAE